MLWDPELDTALQLGPHQSRIQGKNPPPPTCCVGFDAAQDPFGFLGCRCTLPGHYPLIPSNPLQQDCCQFPHAPACIGTRAQSLPSCFLSQSWQQALTLPELPKGTSCSKTTSLPLIPLYPPPQLGRRGLAMEQPHAQGKPPSHHPAQGTGLMGTVTMSLPMCGVTSSWFSQKIPNSTTTEKTPGLLLASRKEPAAGCSGKRRKGR